MSTGESPVASMPITNALYGDDHPRFRPPRPEKERREHGSRIHSLLDEATFKRLARRFPRIRKLKADRKDSK